MTARCRVAEMVGHGVTVLVDLVEQDNRLHYEITGPGYVARLPQCGCDLPGCAGRGRGQATGWHETDATALAEKVLKTYRARKYKPAALNGGARIDPNRAVSYGNFVQLDGEGDVDLYSLKQRSDGSGEPETVAARIVCYSRRCVVDRRQWSRLVVELPGSVYDFKDDPARNPDPRIEGRNPFEVRNEHIAWHRETFGVHPRVALDRWIHDHAMVSAPEPDRAELDRQLAIAKAGA